MLFKFDNCFVHFCNNHLSSTGRTDCAEIEQSSAVFANTKDKVTIKCSHGDSSLFNMYWYQQKSDSTAMALIGYTASAGSPANKEDGFNERFTLNRQSTQKGDLIISELLQSDSAVYYCAANDHSAAYSYDCRLSYY